MRFLRQSLVLLTVSVLSTAVSAAALPEKAYADRPACFDGIDNDTDGRIDYPSDQDCSSIDDTSEWPDTGVFVSITDGKDATAPNSVSVYQIQLRQERENVKLVNLSVMLPPQLGITYVSDDGTEISGAAVWRNVAVFKGQARMLYVHAMVAPNAQPGLLLVARAVADNATATDTTMLKSVQTTPNANNMLIVNVTDGQERAMPNQMLNYVITVQNPETTPALVHVRVPIPAALTVSSSTPASERIGEEIVWRDVFIQPKQTKVYTISATVRSVVPNAYPIQLVAKAGKVAGYDRTIIGNGQETQTILRSGLSDGMSSASRGQVITYTLYIDNSSSWLEPNARVNASIPQYGEFLFASEGGTWDGRNIRWPNLVVAPGGSRTLQFSVRVRSDAPNGAVLRATSYVQGLISNDDTRVNSSGYASQNANNWYYAPSYNSQAYGYHRAASDIRLEKSSDRSEVTAGDTVQFSISVQNTTANDIRGVIIQDTFDESQVWLSDYSGAQLNGSTIEWVLDVVRPGEIRTVTYVAHVSSNLRRGTSIFNQAKAYVDHNRAGAVPTSVSTLSVALPRTGASDGLFAPVEDTNRYLSPVATQRSTMLVTIISTIGLVAAGSLLIGLKRGA